MEACEGIPVIFLTAKVEESDIVRGFEEGAVDYVKKPFNSQELLARIRTHLKLLRKDKTIARIVRDQKYLLRLLTHDLAGNLSGMDSMALWAGQEGNRVGELSAFIRTATENSMELIRAVQQLAEVEGNRTALSLEETDLTAAVNTSLSMIGDLARAKGIELKVKQDFTGIVRADRVTLINTVLRNILHNAIKFTSRGGEIEITTAKTSEGAQLLISDNGSGFPDELQSRVFTEERLQSRAGTEKEPGSGFGLYLTGRLMEAYGASISIEPTDASGTVVKMVFQIP
jgi:signal transduction histidine kinase